MEAGWPEGPSSFVGCLDNWPCTPTLQVLPCHRACPGVTEGGPGAAAWKHQPKSEARGRRRCWGRRHGCSRAGSPQQGSAHSAIRPWDGRWAAATALWGLTTTGQWPAEERLAFSGSPSQCDRRGGHHPLHDHSQVASSVLHWPQAKSLGGHRLLDAARRDCRVTW